MTTVGLPVGRICRCNPGEPNPGYEIAGSCSDGRYGTGYEWRKPIFFYVFVKY